MTEKLAQYAEVYRKALSDERSTNWARGQIAAEISDLHEKDKTQKILQQFLQATGETRVAFNQYKWVWKKFETSKNRELPGLSWTHYRVAAGTDTPDEWIQKAFDAGWTVRQMVVALEDAKVDSKIDDGLTCAFCNNSVTKENKLTISYMKKKAIFCGIGCAKKYLVELEGSKEHGVQSW